MDLWNVNLFEDDEGNPASNVNYSTSASSNVASSFEKSELKKMYEKPVKKRKLDLKQEKTSSIFQDEPCHGNETCTTFDDIWDLNKLINSQEYNNPYAISAHNEFYTKNISWSNRWDEENLTKRKQSSTKYKKYE